MLRGQLGGSMLRALGAALRGKHSDRDCCSSLGEEGLC